MDRQEAERTLHPREQGLFLVRESNNYPGDYTLCVCCEGKVEHYHIMYKDTKLTIDEEEYFENLTKLVEVSRSHGGPLPSGEGMQGHDQRSRSQETGGAFAV